jgi:uncharacterized protein (TIGR01244 family)
MKRSAVWMAVLLVGRLATAGTLDELPQHSQPTPLLHASGQPSEGLLQALPEAGIKVVIDLRPAAERPQLDEAAVVRKAGLTYENLPVAGKSGLTLENVQAFDALLHKYAAVPVVAHCSTSNRVGALLALRAAWIQGMSPAAALAVGEKAGLRGLKDDVAALLSAGHP